MFHTCLKIPSPLSEGKRSRVYRVYRPPPRLSLRVPVMTLTLVQFDLLPVYVRA